MAMTKFQLVKDKYFRANIVNTLARYCFAVPSISSFSTVTHTVKFIGNAIQQILVR